MKYLLHSRKFKSMLFKWVFCYIGTMVFFTAVVTYSRYISSISRGSSTSTAKFKVAISDVCTDEERTKCGNGSYRAKKDNKFYFEVNTKDIEVSSIFETKITLSDGFSFNTNAISIKTENGSSWISYADISTLYPDLEISVDGNTIIFKEDIRYGNGYIRNYLVDVSYNDYENNYGMGLDTTDVIKVDFSATQKN